MKQVLSFIGKSALNTLKKGIDDMRTMVSEFDAEAAKADLLKKSLKLKAEVNTLLERVRNYAEKFEVDIPFDKEKETFVYTMDESMIHVLVESKDGVKRQTMDVNIPENVDSNKVSQKYDAEKKILTIVIAKKF